MNQRVSARQSGFTILEIMIATAILVVGLMGLLAMFPVAMKSGTITIQDTQAALIARSVEQAIREGIENRKGQEENGYHTYFLFQHDGVVDPLPRRIEDASSAADHYILFPTPRAAMNDAKQAQERGDAYQQGKVFVYPETDGLSWIPVRAGLTLPELEDDSAGADPNGNGNPALADDDKDDYIIEGSSGRGTSVRRELGRDILVMKTFPLSNRFLDLLEEDADGEKVVDNDPISQYSFAFAIRPACRDSSLDRSHPFERSLVPAGELYEVEILVYRSFVFVKGGNRADPILRKTILVHR